MTPSYREDSVKRIKEAILDFTYSMSARDHKRFDGPVKIMHVQLDIIMQDIDLYRMKHQDDPHLHRMK